jgi:hypothetical protein
MPKPELEELEEPRALARRGGGGAKSIWRSVIARVKSAPAPYWVVGLGASALAVDYFVEGRDSIVSSLYHAVFGKKVEHGRGHASLPLPHGAVAPAPPFHGAAAPAHFGPLPAHLAEASPYGAPGVFQPELFAPYYAPPAPYYAATAPLYPARRQWPGIHHYGQPHHGGHHHGRGGHGGHGRW